MAKVKEVAAPETQGQPKPEISTEGQSGPLESGSDSSKELGSPATLEVLAAQTPLVVSETPVTKVESKKQEQPKEVAKGKTEVKVKKELEPDPEPEIPEDVKTVLKRFPLEKELYVDKWGGTYTKDTQPGLIKNAILYKNPFYNE